MSTRFEVVLEHDDTYFFQLRMDDGSVILRSLGSDSKIMTQNEVLHLRNSLRDDSRLVPHGGEDGSFFLVVKDRDGSVLARTPRAKTRPELDELTSKLLASSAAPMVDLSKSHHAH